MVRKNSNSSVSSDDQKEQADKSETPRAGRKYEMLDVWRYHRKANTAVFSQNTNFDRTDTEVLDSMALGNDDEEVAAQEHYCGCKRGCTIHPYNPRRSAWDISSLLLVLYDMVVIPLGFFEPPESTFLTLMEWVTRIFWTLDMPLSFLSGYVTGTGSIELRFSKIARRYSRSWFSLDLLVVGVDWLDLLLSAAAGSLGFARLGKSSRVFRILRMIRLLRLARMSEVLNLLTERLDSEKLVILIDMAKLMVVMVGSAHLLGSMWYAIGNADNSELNWLVQEGYKERSLGFRYVMSLRWAISQYAGGMDEIVPYSMGENVYAIFVYLGAFWSGAVFLSILTSSMTQWYIMGSQQAQQLTVLRRYLSQNSISKKLALRVQRNAQHAIREQQKTTPEKDVPIILQVSEPLRVEIHFEMYSPPLSIHPFFARYAAECPHIVRKICHSACAQHHISLGDTIFNVGESPPLPKLYILLRGVLAYKQSSEDAVKVERDQWISEPCLYVNWTHRGTLSAAQDCGIFTLDAKEFQTIVVHFEHHSAINPMSYAMQFVDNLNKMSDASDLLEREFMIDYLGPHLRQSRATALRSTYVKAQSVHGANGVSRPSFMRNTFTSTSSQSKTFTNNDSDWAIKSPLKSLEASPYKELEASTYKDTPETRPALVEERINSYNPMTSIAASTNVGQSGHAEFAEVEEVNYRYRPANSQQARRKHVAIVEPAIVPLDEDEHFLAVPGHNALDTPSDQWVEETEV